MLTSLSKGNLRARWEQLESKWDWLQICFWYANYSPPLSCHISLNKANFKTSLWAHISANLTTGNQSSKISSNPYTIYCRKSGFLPLQIKNKFVLVLKPQCLIDIQSLCHQILLFFQVSLCDQFKSFFNYKKFGLAPYFHFWEITLIIITNFNWIH
jgi:hypothetical protein